MSANDQCVIRILLLAVALSCAAAAVAESGWGTLRGHFVLEGEPPKLVDLDPGKDPVCCQAEPINESLVLGEHNAIANVVVYLRPKRGDAVKVNANYSETAQEPVKVTNKGCAFVPHVVLVRKGQPLIIANDDQTSHNVKADLLSDSFNILLAAGGKTEIELKDATRLPMPLACNLHPFMKAWILVRDDPYMAVSDREGKFEIANLPAGEHEFQLWHEMAGYLGKAKIKGAKVDRRGRLGLDIPDDDVLDLGDIVVDAKSLEK